jgi:hypothetical protein
MAATTTVQNILDGVAQDIRNILTSPADDAILIDYTNRINQTLLRASRWQFLLAPVKRFITLREQTDYWLGAAGSNPAGTVDTGLNLTDLDVIKQGSVFDRSNFRSLLRVTESPLITTLSLRDATSRPARLALWRHDPDTPDVINLYPAPDNQNSFQPEPPTPILESVTSGALSQRTYFVKTTFVDTEGNESTPSVPAATRLFAASDVALVKAPQPGITTNDKSISYDRFNVYASETEGSETKQTPSPLDITGDWQEPDTGLISGAALPTTNSLSTLGGYVIEFRYYESPKQLALVADVLQIPDRYKDIVIAGVNYLASQYLKRKEDAGEWFSTFSAGIRQMIHNKHLFPRGADYVRPDSATLGNMLPSIESFDFSLLPGS